MPGFFSFLASKPLFGKQRNAVIFAATILPVIASVTSCDGESSSENISLYLTSKSKESLSKMLASRGIMSKEPQFVCISRHAAKDQQHFFKPLYGGGAAFRLKGLVQTDTGIVVGVGRISTMKGEVKDDDFLASIPFFDTVEGTAVVPNTEELNRLIDIPTRVEKTRRDHTTDSLWKGRLPASKVRDASHGAINGVTYTALPFDEQIVVNGHFCGSKYVDSEGRCGYDPALDPDEQEDERPSGPDQHQAASAIAAAEEDTSADVLEEDNTTQSARPTETTECSLCKYIKAGPCTQEFVDWDACVKGATPEENLFTKCLRFTGRMNRCMKKYEYYDIMTAGQNFSEVEEAERKADEAASNTNI